MAIDASQLKIDLEEKERWRRRLSVTVPAPIVETERQKAAAKLASRVNLPGFREGKVPTSVIEQRYGQTLRQETLDRLINDAYREALQVRSLKPISEGELEEVSYEPKEDLQFAISFDVEPEIEIGRLGGFAVERPSATVDEEDVSRVLERLREQNAVWHPREEGQPSKGELVQVRIQQLDEEGEEPREYEFVLGRDEALPDIESAILSMEVGDEEETVVTFPEDFPNEERRGEERHLRIALLGRKVQELPELDDEFAASVGEFESADDVQEAIREDLQREADRESEQEVRSRLLDLIIEANPFQVPESLVEGYVEQVLGDADDLTDERRAEARARIRPQAERAVKRALLIDRIAHTQGLQATEDEVDARVEAIAENNDTSPAKVYAQLQKAGRLSSLEREITEEKVFEFLKGESKITEEA